MCGHAVIHVCVKCLFTCTAPAACDASRVFLNLCTVQLINIKKEVNMQLLADERHVSLVITISYVW